MSPLHKQGRVKAEKRSVQMSSPATDEPEGRWRCPPLEECDDPKPYEIGLPGSSINENKVLVRMISHLKTDELVRIVLVQRTYYKGRWRDVVEVDCCHDVDVHLHQYVRSTGQRNGNDPEVIYEVAGVEDVQYGYNLAYDRVIGRWEENRRRWHDG